MKKQKKILYFLIIIVIFTIIVTFKTQIIQKTFGNLKKSRLDENTSEIPIKELNVTPAISSTSGLLDTDFLIGRYQLNYTGSSNEFAETNSYNISSGISHINVVSAYEEGTYASSSGAYLNGSYNQGGSIYKAYLVIESSGVSNLQNYPITLIYGGEDGTPKNGIKTAMTKHIIRIGYTDITDYIKENGYGWYYCCNIPCVVNSDISADWKIVVIEQNPNLNVRALKLQLGSLYTSTWQSATIDLDGITTKKVGTVTGQLLYNITDTDGTNFGKLQVNSTNQYINLTSKNGYRTSSSPLPGLKLRNTLPLKQLVNYPNPRYYSGNNSSLTKTPGSKSVILTGSDMELLDIDGTTNYHNITINNSMNSVSIRVNPSPYWVDINMFGIVYDIDVPIYTSTQSTTPHDDYYATINGKVENISTQTQGIGLHNGKITVKVDKGLEILSTTAYFTGSDGTKVNLSDLMYEINHENNTITYIYGKDSSGRSLIGESITYTIETISTKLQNENILDHTVQNEVTANGKLIYNYKDLDYQMDNIISNKSTATLQKPLILTIDPNGGTYENSNTTTTYKLYAKETKQLSTPIKNGYTFTGWSSSEDDTEIHNNTITIKNKDITLTANWKLDELILTSKVNLNLANQKGGIELDWSNYNSTNKYFIIYRKQENSENWESIIKLEDQYSQNTYVDILANDIDKPLVPKINISASENHIIINTESEDTGTTYSYYIESYDSTTQTILNKSNISSN